MSDFIVIELDKNITPKIKLQKDKDILLDENVYLEYQNLKKKAAKIDNNFVKKISEISYRIDDTNYLFILFNLNYDQNLAYYICKNNSFYISSSWRNNESTHISVKDAIKQNKKWKSIVSTMISKELYNKVVNLSYCERNSYLMTNYLERVNYLFDFLEVGGVFLFAFMNICNPVQLNIIYLLANMFDKVIIYNGIYIYCEGFLGKNSRIERSEIEKIIDKKSEFTIDHKPDCERVSKEIMNIFKYFIKLFKFLLNGKIDEYIDMALPQIYERMMVKNQNKDDLVFFYKLTIDTLKRSFINGKIIKINSSIKSTEGKFIDKIIKKYNLKNCLEVGMAFGISALYILASSKNISLISIDPFQSTQWNNMGKKLLKEFGFDNRHKCIEKKSYEAMPILLIKKREYDFIFIDGWHTFDYTLVDFFYADLLLKKDGIIIIDDALHKGVEKCVRYLETNFTHFKKLESPKTVACFQKIKDDERTWDFHRTF